MKLLHALWAPWWNITVLTLASNTNKFQFCQAFAIHTGVEVFAHVVDDAWLLVCWFVCCVRWWNNHTKVRDWLTSGGSVYVGAYVRLIGLLVRSSKCSMCKQLPIQTHTTRLTYHEQPIHNAHTNQRNNNCQYEPCTLYPINIRHRCMHCLRLPGCLTYIWTP